MEHSARQMPTRREKFLTDLDRVAPWSAPIALIEPHYYRGERGRPPEAAGVDAVHVPAPELSVLVGLRH